MESINIKQQKDLNWEVGSSTLAFSFTPGVIVCGGGVAGCLRASCKRGGMIFKIQRLMLRLPRYWFPSLILDLINRSYPLNLARWMLANCKKF